MRGPGSIRQILSRGVRALRRRLRGEPESGWLEGLPDGLAPSELAVVCDLLGGGEPIRKSHRHLSAWKQSGASRVLLEMSGGKSRSFVFKRADYGLEQIPALMGLPLRPGLPEFRIYSSTSRALSDYLPEVYRVDELVSRERYHYFLEDLTPSHRVATGISDLLVCAGQLPSIHVALRRFYEESGQGDLLHFGDRFWEALLGYAEKSLDRFQETAGSELARQLAATLPTLSGLRQRVQERIPFLEQPIHGDYNVSNLLLPIASDGGMKVLDWEWAGIGAAHADLASLLKGQSEAVERQGVREYASRAPRLSGDDHWMLYQWCQIERGVFDAAFLATQAMDATHQSSLDLRWCVENSSEIALRKTTALKADLS